MKKVLTKKTTLILVVSAILSLGIIVTGSNSNVPPCFNLAPECSQTSPLGKLTVKDYGYPATYKQTTTFEPVNSSTYASASIEKTSYIHAIFVNIFFWYALISLIITRFFKRK